MAKTAAPRRSDFQTNVTLINYDFGGVRSGHQVIKRILWHNLTVRELCAKVASLRAKYPNSEFMIATFYLT